MTVAVLDPSSQRASSGAPPTLRVLVLARSACDDGCSRPELARDLGFVVSPTAHDHAHAVGGAASRESVQGTTRQQNALDAELAELVRAGLVYENKARFRATPQGLAQLAEGLGAKVAGKSWVDLKDQRLVAKALGLERDSAARVKALARPDQLRAEILGQRFGFRLRGAASAPRLRSELALVALERAFGDSMKGASAVRSGLSAKAARLLAAQLLVKPREVGTDSRLIALLAAEAVDTLKTDTEALRAALLRRFAAGLGATPVPTEAAEHASSPPSLLVAPAPVETSPRPSAASRPGLEGFAAAVNIAASAVAEGWPGNRKALVSRVWQSIEALQPDWGLSSIEFKAMLAEAHRTGHLVLATADLKDKRQLRELADSAISYKNTVWHLVRVQD